MPDLRHTLADAVRAERTRAELTQEELADRAGWPRHVIAAIEAGQRIIGLHEAPALCEALGCDLARLFVDAPRTARQALGL